MTSRHLMRMFQWMSTSRFVLGDQKGFSWSNLWDLLAIRTLAAIFDNFRICCTRCSRSLDSIRALTFQRRLDTSLGFLYRYARTTFLDRQKFLLPTALWGNMTWWLGGFGRATWNMHMDGWERLLWACSWLYHPQIIESWANGRARLKSCRDRQFWSRTIAWRRFDPSYLQPPSSFNDRGTTKNFFCGLTITATFVIRLD